MRKNSLILLALITICLSHSASAQYPVWENMKYGLFVHFVYGGEYGGMTPISSTGSFPANIDAFADAFDVQKFADDVEAMGFEYVIFTAWHANMGVLYPSQVMADYGFDQEDHYTSSRDLLGELIDALAVKGIEFSIYTHIFVGHDFHPKGSGYFSYDNKTGTITQDMINSGYVDAVNGDSKKWNDFVNAVYDEMSKRYGEKVCSYWFDGTWVPDSWVDKQRMMETIRKNNKTCTFVANGTESHGLPYWAKEVNKVASGEYSFSKDYAGVIETDVNTWPSYLSHVAIVQGGNWWASQWGSPKYTAEQVYRYTVLQAGTNNNGGTGWSFAPFVNGAWEGDMLARMTTVGGFIAPVAESIKKTRASTSYVTKPGSRITHLPGKYVATKSVNGLYEYIHVLNKPEGRTLKLPVSADGRAFNEALLLEKNKSVKLLSTVRGYTLTLPEGEEWNDLNTVFRLKLSRFKLSGSNGSTTFVNPWSGHPLTVIDALGNKQTVSYNGDTCTIVSVGGDDYMVTPVLGPEIVSAKVDVDAKVVTINFDKPIANNTPVEGFSLLVNGAVDVVINSIDYTTGGNFIKINVATPFVKEDEIVLNYTNGNVVSAEALTSSDVTGFVVDNLLEGSSPRLIKATTDITGENIILSFNKSMALPDLGNISVFNSTLGQKMAFSSIGFDGNDFAKIVLEASQTIFTNDVLTFSCSATDFSSVDGGFLNAIDNYNIVNIAPGIAPAVIAANVKVDAYTIELELDKPILDISHLKSNFVAEINSVAKPIKSVNVVNGDASSLIVMTLEGAVKNGETITVSFSGNTIYSHDGGMLTSINKYPAVNNVPRVYEPKHFLNIAGAGSAGIQRDTLYVSRLVFTDRDFKFIEVPAALVGAEYIRWQNNQKSTYADVMLSFKMATSGKLYIAHDNRINRPAWLTSNFSRIEQVVSVSGTNSQLFYKNVSANDVISLGANQIQGTETGGCNHYVVFFVPDPVSTGNISGSLVFNELKVYPNPTRDQLFLSGVEGIQKISIMSLSGQCIMEHVGLNMTSVNLDGLEQGMYFVVVETKTQHFKTKVIVGI